MNVLEEMQTEQFLAGCGWRAAVRDDNRLARLVAEGEPVDAVYTLEEEAALDEFLHYLDQGGFAFYFERLASTVPVERVNVPMSRYVWLYFTKILLGIEGLARMSPLLLRDEALMRLLGFNAHQVANGVSRRGDARRGEGTEREGPVSSEAVGKNIVKLSTLALARFFGHIVERVVERAIPEKDVDIIIDCSLYETTDKFTGAGRTTRIKKAKDKNGKLVELRETVYGFKIGTAYHGPTGLPLGVCVTRINTDDRSHFWTLMEDVRKSLGTGRRIRSVVMDRGFLDGEDLWRLQEMGIEFVIPAKTTMNVYKDALALANKYAVNPHCPEVQAERWTESRTVGHGRNASTETLATEVIGVPRLASFDTYGPPDHGKAKNRQDFKPNEINAVVVTEWRGRRFKHPKVFVTNGSVFRPRLPFDRYDDRSLIENGVFREGKQDWSLKSPPQKSEAGVTVHTYLTVAAVALHRCYRLETEGGRPTSKPKPRPVSEGPDRELPLPQLKLGMEKYRLDLKVQNRNKVILFDAESYGILHVQEMAMLGGLNLRDRSQGVGTREETFQKYGLEPPPPPIPRPVLPAQASKAKTRRKTRAPARWYEIDED